MTQNKDIIFVCTGNTCRSPIAEGIFRALDGEAKTGLSAASAGLFTQDGLSASENAVKAAAELGADISNHRSSVLTEELVSNAQYLVCMTGTHYDALLARFLQAKDKIFLLMDRDVSDPFGGTLAVYQASANQINAGVQSLIERLSK